MAPNAATPGPRGDEAGRQENAKLGGLRNLPALHQSATQRTRADNARLRHLAARLHALGERPLFEFLRELVAGADVIERLEAYSDLDPEILVALGARDLPPHVRLVERA